MHDYTQADLDPQTRGMLDFAARLTREPWSMKKEHVEGLRALGLSDEQVLSVVLITCRFNFLTRLADGLGVELESGVMKETQAWLTGPAREQQWLTGPHS